MTRNGMSLKSGFFTRVAFLKRFRGTPSSKEKKPKKTIRKCV
jgi:hypothetical protein